MSDFVPAPHGTEDELAELEARNRDRLAGWWALIGREPDYPVSSADVVSLLRAVEYAADNDVILAYTSERIIPPVPRHGGRLAWDATSIVALSCALEARRKWLPFSKIHAHKWTAIEKLQQVMEHRGEETFTDLATFDIDGLIGMAHSVAHDPGAVQTMLEALRHKLRGMGVV